MLSSKFIDPAGWPDSPPESLGRHLAALVLRAASRALARLARWARRCAASQAIAGRRLPPELEFYAEAGAPEGALYADGQYVGHLPGVSRL